MPNGWINPEFSYGKHSRQWLGHSFRYYLAAGFLEPKDKVGDFGCGVGYGTKILKRNADFVVGVDADPKAIEIAKEKYNGDNMHYVVADFDNDKYFPNVDVGVSFETLEHLRDPERFADRLKGYSRRLIIVSTPVIPTVGVNPHHLHDFTEESFQELFVDKVWTLWEKVRQGPYMILILYRKD